MSNQPKRGNIMNDEQVKKQTMTTVRGFRDFLGLQITELAADHTTMELEITPQHLNSQGSLHGGVLATVVDNSGGLAGCYCHKTGSIRKAVTLSLTTSFLAPASSGKIRAISRKRSAGRRIFTATTDIYDEAGKLIAIGEATYRYLSETVKE